MITKVISGGQSGADIAGVRAAKRAGLATGGSLPKGFRTEDGMRPGYAKEFQMVALDEEDYPARTRKNVADADVTLIIGYDTSSPGSRTTQRAVREYHKVAKSIEIPRDFLYRESTHPHRRRLPDSEYADGEAIVADLVQWLTARDPATVNIAGNREPRLEEPVEAILFEVFTRLKDNASKAPFTLDL